MIDNKIDLTTNTTAFGLLPKEAREEIERRFDEALVYTISGFWQKPFVPEPQGNLVYRLPERERFVNWDIFTDDIVAAAMNQHGDVVLFGDIPVIMSGRWNSKRPVRWVSTINSKYLYLGEKEDWKNSLMIRPK